jgi:hypothetical protein
MKEVLSWLVRWACRAVTRDFFSLAALVGPVSNIFPHRTLFQCLCPHRPASWTGSRAGSPVSYTEVCVSGYYTFVQGKLPSTTK